MAEKISLLSYNIHKGFSVRYRKYVIEEIREQLQKIDADIMCLQEIHGQLKERRIKKHKIQHEPQPELLANPNWPFHIYGKNAIYGDAHHGNAVLSKFPFQMWQNINLSFHPRASRSLLHGVIEWDGISVHVICVHLGLFKIERVRQMKILEGFLNTEISSVSPLIIAGDFNDWQTKIMDQVACDFELGEVFLDLFGEHVKTYPARNPSFAIDRIYYRGLKLREAGLFQDEVWKKLSDHLPLWAEFERK